MSLRLKYLVLTILVVSSVMGMNGAFAQESYISVQTDDKNYDEGDTIIISGQVTEIVGSTPVTLQIFTEGNLVEIVQATVAQDGSYSHTVLAEGPLWEEFGKYSVRSSYQEGNVVETSFYFEGSISTPTTSDVHNLTLGINHDSSSDKIIVYGTTSNTEKDISLKVISPSEVNVVAISQISPKLNGEYYGELNIGPAWSEVGYYKIIAIQVTPTNLLTEYFEVWVNQDDFTVQSSAQITESITVQTDKTSYSEGELVIISGEVRDLYSGTPVSVIVTAPRDSDGNGEDDLVSISQVEVGNNKKFRNEMTAGGALMKTTGIYTVVVQYGTVNRSDTTTFYFEGDTTVAPPDQEEKTKNKFTVDTNRHSYTSNDFIKITGNVSPLAEYSQSVTILVVSPDGDIITIVQVIPSANGAFSTTVKADSAMTVSGNYEIRAQYGAQKITNSFVFTVESVSPQPTIPPSPNTPSNDNKTIIDLKNKIIDLKLENRELKQEITSLNDEIEQLEDLLLNGLKEIYNWLS